MDSYTFLLLLLTNYLTQSSAHVTYHQNYNNQTRIKRQSNCKEFQCASGECIADELQCDGTVNCKDGSDETFACRNIPCQPFLFQCSYGACINGDYECDGKTDCKDNSDETSPKCKRETTTVPTTDCGTNKFTCKNGECIDDLDLCDGIINCKDGSDETREACHSIDCPKYTFKCTYGGCVDGNAKCNGKQDCIDNSDEEFCDGIIKPTPKPTTTTTTPKPVQVGSCIVPKEPTNGHSTVGGDIPYRSGDEVPNFTLLTNKCNANHALLPNNAVIYCINGQWNSEIPKCERLCQPINPSPSLQSKCFKEESVVSCSKPFSGTRAKFSCAPLYEDFALKQNPYRYCKEGTWDRNLPNCVPECGMKFVNAQPLIIGGVIAKKDHWPWVVAVYIKGSKEHICGGSILNQKVVLSAAHCFTDSSGNQLSSSLYVIGAGKHYRDFNHADDPNSQVSDVEQIYIPSDYLGDTQNYRADIAVVILTEAFQLSNNVRPVCIDWGSSFERDQLRTGETGVVLGWGLTSEGGKASPELKELDVPYHQPYECIDRLPAEFRRFATTGDKICGGYYNKSTSVCQGDSGGGYVFELNDKYYLRGIVSVSPQSQTQYTCDSNHYTLFTKVSKYEDFIYEYESKHRPII